LSYFRLSGGFWLLSLPVTALKTAVPLARRPTPATAAIHPTFRLFAFMVSILPFTFAQPTFQVACLNITSVKDGVQATEAKWSKWRVYMYTLFRPATCGAVNGWASWDLYDLLGVSHKSHVSYKSHPWHCPQSPLRPHPALTSGNPPHKKTRTAFAVRALS
jgi:hypothetical protein